MLVCLYNLMLDHLLFWSGLYALCHSELSALTVYLSCLSRTNCLSTYCQAEHNSNKFLRSIHPFFWAGLSNLLGEVSTGHTNAMVWFLIKVLDSFVLISVVTSLHWTHILANEIFITTSKDYVLLVLLRIDFFGGVLALLALEDRFSPCTWVSHSEHSPLSIPLWAFRSEHPTLSIPLWVSHSEHPTLSISIWASHSCPPNYYQALQG